MILGYDRNDWERFSIKNPIQVKIGKNISSNCGEIGFWKIIICKMVYMAITP